MAKRAKAKAKSKSKAKAKAIRTSAASGSLVDPSPPPQPVRRRQLVRRDSDEKIERAIQLHFKNMTASQLASTTINGMTVRERVAHDRAALIEAGGYRLGATYWRALAAEYGQACLSFSNIEPRDRHEPVAEDLLKALGTATSADCQARNSEAFCIYLQYVAELGDRTQLGIAKTIEAHTNIGRSAQDALWTAFASCLARTNYANTQDAVREALKPVMDAVLTRTWARLHKNSVKVETFITTHRSLLALVMNETDLAAIAACGGNWSSVPEPIRRVTESSSVGALCFQFAMASMHSKGLSTAVDTALATLELQKLDCKKFATWRMELGQKIKVFTESDALDEKRTITVRFNEGDVPLATVLAAARLFVALSEGAKVQMGVSEGFALQKSQPLNL